MDAFLKAKPQFVDPNQIDSLIEEIRLHLPIQNPLQTFVHNNILLNYEDLPFHQAVNQASFYYNARPYCEEVFYEDALKKGRISQELLYSLAESSQTFTAPVAKPLRLRHVWEERYGPTFTRMKHDFVIPMLSTFMDQGLSDIPNPFRSEGLWSFFVAQLEHRPKFARSWLPSLPSTQLDNAYISSLIAQAYVAPVDAQQYCLEILFDLKGWSGMLNKLEVEPEQAPVYAPRVSLKEWLTLCLVLENALNRFFLNKANLTLEQAIQLRNDQNQRPSARYHFKKYPLPIWQEAFEQTFAQRRIESLESHFIALRKSEWPERPLSELSGQVLFCIDDREESLRRHLATVAPKIETCGVVGFFNVDMELQIPAQKGEIPQKPRAQCPPVIKPTKKVFLREDGSYDYQGPEGYSVEDSAQIVGQILTICGINKRLSPAIVVLSHGSTSANNPFIQAYGCGACGGNSGYPNAIVFASMANDPRVRALLHSKHGIQVPSTTRFIAAYHDTCSDEIIFRETIDPYLKRSLLIATQLNSKERCLRFEMVSPLQSPKNSLIHVQNRARDFSQPRPEYGHSMVALCVVGRRDLTQEQNLDRRSFLVTYHPELDPDGSVLEQAVIGAVPVCANISLDYYFSRVDNDKFGAGTKLPLNITSRLGVMTGSRSDLRIGLAGQMVEIHEPMRILVLIEADYRYLINLFTKHQRLKKLVKNEWIRIGHIHPNTGEIKIIRGDSL